MKLTIGDPKQLSDNPQLEWCKIYGLHEWGIWRVGKCKDREPNTYDWGRGKHWCTGSQSEYRICTRCGAQERRRRI